MSCSIWDTSTSTDLDQPFRLLHVPYPRHKLLTHHLSDDHSRLFPCTSPFFVWPFFGPLLFENQTSDARDHCANERTFLSYLRLSIYMAIVSVAIVLSFHVKNQPSAAELAMATPLGVLFWLLSVACLLVGLGNYIGEFICLGRLAGGRRDVEC